MILYKFLTLNLYSLQYNFDMNIYLFKGQTSSEGKEHTDANRSRSTNELIRFALIPGVVLIIASVAVMNIISHGEIIFLSQFLIKEVRAPV